MLTSVLFASLNQIPDSYFNFLDIAQIFVILIHWGHKASDMKSLREMYDDEALPMQARRREALVLERQLSHLVNEAYGLTPDDVALLWSTAPPRMPFKPEEPSR